MRQGRSLRDLVETTSLIIAWPITPVKPTTIPFVSEPIMSITIQRTRTSLMSRLAGLSSPRGARSFGHINGLVTDSDHRVR